MQLTEMPWTRRKQLPRRDRRSGVELLISRGPTPFAWAKPALISTPRGAAVTEAMIERERRSRPKQTHD